MHHCLKIPEILLDIFQRNVVETHPDTRSADCLLDFTSLARTCRDFHEPAMNILWHTMEDLAPVFRCLPRDAWYELEGRELSAGYTSYDFFTTLVSELYRSVFVR